MQTSAQSNKQFDSAEFMKVVHRHVDAEVAGDVDAVMATICDEPHFEIHPAGLILTTRSAVREFYKRSLAFFPKVTPMEDSASWDKGDVSKFIGARGIVTRDFGKITHNGREVLLKGLAWMVPDPASGLFKGEHIFMNAATAAVLRDLLGKEFETLPGVRVER